MAALSFLLGTVLLVAGLRKLRSGKAFEAAIRELAPGRAARALKRTVPVCELAVGAWLLSGFAGVAAAATAVALLILFSTAIVRLAASGRYADCGCFGEALGADRSPRLALMRNAALALAGVTLLVLPDSTPVWRGELVEVVGTLTVAFGLFLAWCCVAALVRPLALETS